MRKTGALLGAVTLSVTLAGCWEQVGYDAGHTYWNSGESTLTPANVDQLEQLWSYDTGADPAESLLSVAGKVFVGDKLGTVRTATALNAANGSLLWTHTEEVENETVVTDFVHRDGNLEVAWSWATLGGIIGIDADTGARAFTEGGGPGNHGKHSLADVGGDRVIAGRGPHPQFGDIVTWVSWRCDARFVAPSSSDPNGGDAFAFVGDHLMWSFGTEARGFRDCDAGSGTWTTTWSTPLQGKPVGIAAVGANQVVYTDDSGTMTLLDATTGAVQWSTDVGAQPVGPTVAGDKIFVTNLNHQFVAYDAATGAKVWEADFAVSNLRPVAGGDVVYLVAGNSLLAWAVDGCGAATCSELASVALGGTPEGPPIVDDGRVIVGLHDGRVVAFGLPG